MFSRGGDGEPDTAVILDFQVQDDVCSHPWFPGTRWCLQSSLISRYKMMFAVILDFQVQHDVCSHPWFPGTRWCLQIWFPEVEVTKIILTKVLDLPPSPSLLHIAKVQNIKTVCGGWGWYVELCWRPNSAGVNTLFLTRFRTYKIDRLQPKQKPRRGGGLRQIITCRKVPLQVNFLR